jgi:excisionase family DNA binding protein
MDTAQGNVTGRGPKSPLPIDVPLAYRINDAVRVSGLSRSSLYELIAQKKLRSVMVAGRRLIPASALRELLQVA